MHVHTAASLRKIRDLLPLKGCLMEDLLCLYLAIHEPEGSITFVVTTSIAFIINITASNMIDIRKYEFQGCLVVGCREARAKAACDSMASC